MNGQIDRPNERISVFINADLKDAFYQYMQDNNHTEKWLIEYMIRELLNGKTYVKRQVSVWSKKA